MAYLQLVLQIAMALGIIASAVQSFVNGRGIKILNIQTNHMKDQLMDAVKNEAHRSGVQEGRDAVHDEARDLGGGK